MNTFKKGDRIKLADRYGMYTVRYISGPYVYYSGCGASYTANAHYSRCTLVPQPKFGPGDVVRNSWSQHTIKCVKTTQYDGTPYTGPIAYDYTTKDDWDEESCMTLVRRANEVTLGDILAAAVKPNLADIERELGAGRYIEAIKKYRLLHNVGLKEAKDAIDAMRAAPAATAIVARFENGSYSPNETPKIHKTVSAATAEAERLAKKEPGVGFGVFVLASTSTATKPVVSTVSTVSA